MTSQSGCFALVLHAHLPYVLRHDRWPHGSDWLCEAAADCYIPLLNVFHQLIKEGISPQVTINISPVLAEQLADEDFKIEFKNFLDQRLRACQQDRQQFGQSRSAEQNAGEETVPYLRRREWGGAVITKRQQQRAQNN